MEYEASNLASKRFFYSYGGFFMGCAFLIALNGK